jgi:hypothetical protein
MIESFDKDLELAIDRKIVEKQHKMIVDSLKRNGVGVKLNEEINSIVADYFTGVIDMIEVGNRYEKAVNKDIENTFKEIYNKLPAEDGFKNRGIKLF